MTLKTEQIQDTLQGNFSLSLQNLEKTDLGLLLTDEGGVVILEVPDVTQVMNVPSCKNQAVLMRDYGLGMLAFAASGM